MYRSKTAVVVALVVATIGLASESKAQRRTGTGSMQLGQRWATPGGGKGQTWSPVPGRQSSSPSWTLRPGYSNSRSVVSGYGSSRSRHTRSYSAAPGRIQYSHPPHHRSHHSYSVYPHVYIQYQNYGSGFFNPYDEARILNGLPFQYGMSYGPVYPSIVAPPIVVPFGGLNSTAVYKSGSPAITSQAPYIPSPTTAVSSPPAPVAKEQGNQVESRQLAIDESPVVNEFGDGAIIASEDVSTVDRIRSLRYQTSGDDAFRRQDYAAAAGLYQAAAETAPKRRAPQIRLAWANIAEENYSAAVLSLKTALLMPDDPTSSWINGDMLYGKSGNAQQAIHGDELWDWLQRRPNSTDRLLTAAAFQKLRGYSGVSRELLQAALQAGLDERLRRALVEISIPAENEEEVDANPAAEVDDGGLRMKGKEILPANHAVNAGPGLPEAISPKVEDVPVPQSDLVPMPETESLIIPAR